MIDTKALMTCFEFFSKIFVRSSRASKQQQKLFGDFTDTQEILGRISTELQAMKELTETLYSTAQKLGGRGGLRGDRRKAWSLGARITISCHIVPLHPEIFGNQTARIRM